LPDLPESHLPCTSVGIPSSGLLCVENECKTQNLRLSDHLIIEVEDTITVRDLIPSPILTPFYQQQSSIRTLGWTNLGVLLNDVANCLWPSIFE